MLFYTFRLFNNLFQGDPVGMSKFELWFYWALTLDGAGVPNWVDIFVQSCVEVQGI